MPLINCKTEVSSEWIETCVLTTAAIGYNANATGADSATFEITDAKFYVSIVTLSAEDNVKLSKLLSEGFKRSVYWSIYKIIDNIVVQIAAQNEEKYIRERLDASCQGVKRLFVLAYDNASGNTQVSIDCFKKYFPPGVKIENCNIEIDGRNFYDQLINGSIKQYGEIRKKSTGQDDEYTIGCLLDFAYFEKKKYRLIAADLSKQKALEAGPRAIQQIIFTGKVKSASQNKRVIIYYILEQSKETMLELAKGTAKVL